MKNPIDLFIEQYIAGPKGSSPELLADNVCKWFAVANNPEESTRTRMSLNCAIVAATLARLFAAHSTITRN